MQSSMPMTPEDLDQLARRRANAKLGWYLHAIAFVLVNALIFAMSRYAFGTRPWSVYPLLGWGVGVVVLGVWVFLVGSGRGRRERWVPRAPEALQRRQDRP